MRTSHDLVEREFQAKLPCSWILGLVEILLFTQIHVFPCFHLPASPGLPLDEAVNEIRFLCAYNIYIYINVKYLWVERDGVDCTKGYFVDKLDDGF